MTVAEWNLSYEYINPDTELNSDTTDQFIPFSKEEQEVLDNIQEDIWQRQYKK